MTWLDRIMAEGAGRMGQDPAPEEKTTPRSDRWAGPLFDETLESLSAGLPSDDGRDLREERAAILEFEAGMTREEAERRAGLSERTERP